MPLETARSQTRLVPELALPPPFTAIRLREVGDAFAHAVAIAPEKGAGTLVYVGRFDLAEFAVVLEPEEPLLKARACILCRHGGSCRRARRSCATGNVDHDRLAGFASGQSEGWSAVAGSAWPEDAREDRHSAVARLRRHDPAPCR